MAQAKRRASRPSAEGKSGDAITARAPLMPRMAALLLVVICLLPFVAWENPYPDTVIRYWLLSVVAIALAWMLSLTPAQRALSPLLRVRERAHAMSPLAFAATVAVFAALLSVVMSVYAFHRSPSITDEIAQLWQAKILLSGRLSLPPDPNPEFFALDTVVDSTRWYAQFPIGGPVIMMLGALFGVPWIINPILCGISAAALYHFARRTFDESSGRAVGAVFSVSPSILLMSGTMMNHVPVLCFTSCMLAALVEWECASTRTLARRWAAAVGLALGVIATIRPLDALVLSVVVGAFQLFVIRKIPSRWTDLLVQGAAGSLAIIALLVANAAQTGHPLLFGYEALWGAGHGFGFHTDPYGQPFTVQDGVRRAIAYVSQLNMYVTAWPIPSVLLAVVALLLMRKPTRWDALLLSLFCAQVAAYAAYWFVGDFLGPRFLFTALPTIIVLIARIPTLAGQRLGDNWQRRAAALCVICVVIAWSTPFMSFSAWGIANQTRSARRTMRLDVAAATKAAGLHNALVFLREPIDARLTRRLWGLGASRGIAAQLVTSYSTCALLTAIRTTEHDAHRIPGTLTPTAPGSIQKTFNTPECQAERAMDSAGGFVPFGIALPHENIGRDGRIGGDIVYAADLGEHNEVLKTRFGDRAWYRLSSEQRPDGSLRAVLAQY